MSDSQHSTTPCIIAENLAIGYNTQQPLIAGINLQIDFGNITLITGPNGSGKSTLVQTILGLLPKVAGRLDICTGSPGYVPQFNRVDEQLPLSIYDVVALGVPPRTGNLSTAAHRREILDRLAAVGLEGKEELLFRNASGGQKQRTLIARALLGNPALLIMDEPFSNLDKSGHGNLTKILNKLHKEQNMTLVVIDHSISRDLLAYDQILDVGTW